MTDINHTTTKPFEVKRELQGTFDELEEHVHWELADVMIYSIAMAYDLGFDIEEMIHEKLEKNNEKYPAKK